MIFSFFLKVLSIIILISIIQSLYGVGILLFGTPLLLLFGLPFSQVLIILLPISFTISSIQIFRGWNFVRLEFVRLFILYTLPSTIISLSLILYYKEKINLNLYVGIYILLFSLSFYFKNLENSLQQFMKQRRIYLIVCGIIHGLTNLGGSLLSAFIINKYSKKEEIRSTVAMCYLFLVIIQIIVLFLFGFQMEWNKPNVYYLLISIVVFYLIEFLLYKKLTNTNFRKYFGHILLIMGIFLILKSLGFLPT